MQNLREALDQRFGTDLRGFNVEAHYGYGFHSVVVTLSYDYQYETNRTLPDVYDIRRDLTFSYEFQPVSISQQLNNFNLKRDIIAHYIVQDLEEFTDAIVKETWRLYDKKITSDIDRAING